MGDRVSYFRIETIARILLVHQLVQVVADAFQISPDHAYAVLGYDKGTDLFHVWNPHGNNFTPKGPDGLQNGYAMKRGEFNVPLKDMDEIFSDLEFETKANTKK